MNRFLSLFILTVLLTACTGNTAVLNQSTATEVPVIVTQTTVIDVPTFTPTELPSEAAPTAFPTPRNTPTAWPTPTSGPTPFGGSEQIIFGLSTRKAENYQGAGVYLLNFLSEQLTQVFETGYRLQSVSPDGRWLLVNKDNQLYLSGLLGDGVVLLTDKLVVNPGITAIWTENGENIIWVENGGAENYLVIADAMGEDLQATQAGLPHQPLMLFPSENLEQVVWKAGICGDATFCGSGIWVSSLNQQISQHFDTISFPNFGSSENGYALALVQEQDQISLQVLSQPALESVNTLDIGDDYPTAFSFSGSGSRVAVLGQVRSDYSGKTFGNRLVLFSGADWKSQELSTIEGLNGVLAWSPDDQHLALMTTNVDEVGYRIELVRQNAASTANQVYTENLAIKNESFIFVSALKWVP
ncbi:MAG: hypothetical protein CL609_13345 [Anaerolineaceae bacterium]|nr:hypothetical protein [Anaerolineaceae bacterium]